MNTFFKAGLAGVALLSQTVVGAESASTPTRPPVIIHERHGSNVSSTNWSGYAFSGTKKSVTDVKGSWIVPSVNCNSTNAYASFWIGIDGYNSNTVEQIGTDSDCQGGSAVYYAWFEFYPHPSFTVNTLTIKPGDVISAEVRAGSGGEFTVTITDGTQTFSTTTKLKSADLSSAEWIIEAPYSGGVLPLADFVSVSFGDKYTGISGTCTAVYGGVSQTIGPFSKGYVDEITMVTKDGTIKSQPGGLSKDNAGFTDAWVSAGP